MSFPDHSTTFNHLDPDSHLRHDLHHHDHNQRQPWRPCCALRRVGHTDWRRTFGSPGFLDQDDDGPRKTDGVDVDYNHCFRIDQSTILWPMRSSTLAILVSTFNLRLSPKRSYYPIKDNVLKSKWFWFCKSNLIMIKLYNQYFQATPLPLFLWRLTLSLPTTLTPSACPTIRSSVFTSVFGHSHDIHFHQGVVVVAASQW